MAKKKEITVRIINESGKNLSKELAKVWFKLYQEGKLNFKKGE